MKAYRIKTNEPISPFGDEASTIPILNQPLAKIQEQTLKVAGFNLVDEVPADEPYLLLTDRIWFTAELLRRLKPHRGQLASSDKAWSEGMHCLQDLKYNGGYELAMIEAGGAPLFENLEPVSFNWDLRDAEPMDLHPSMAHAQKQLRVGPCMVHQLHHWSHVLRINQLAIANIGEEVRLKWREGNIFVRLWMAILFLCRVRSINRQQVLARIGTIGKNCQIHPTAIIEACHIGDNVVVGPYAVVRASVLGDGVKIEEYATVNISVVGAETRINRYALANLCVLFDRVMISHGCGYQGCVIGRDAFTAWDVTAIDLSFGKTIQVQHNGEWVDSGQHFLGAAIGHRAVLGNRVRINYGVSIPNDAVLVGPIDDMIKDASQAEPKRPYCVDGFGGVKPIGRGQPKQSDSAE